ncbi:MAG TPA: CARDB domain-containing protein, partial [Herpetosiphonaceae bacterium]
TVSFTVINQGNADVTQRFLVAIEADELNPTTVVVDSLAAGQQIDLRARLGPGGNCYNPNCTVTVTVDPNNVIPEFDETNNIATDTWNG